MIGGGLSVTKEDSLAAASLLGDDAATVYTRYTQHSKSTQAKKTQTLTHVISTHSLAGEP